MSSPSKSPSARAASCARRLLAIGPKRVGDETTAHRSARRSRYDCGRPAARVRGRTEIANQAELLERRLELGAELAPLDARERSERGLHRGSLAVAREVGTQASPQVARLPDVQHRVVPVPEEIDAGRRRRAGDQRAARVQPPGARRRELDHLGERPRAALLREPEERDENLGRRERIGQRAMAGLARRAEEVRELAQREALAPAMQQPPREPHGVDDRRGDPLAGEVGDGAIEEADVEARVVGGERRVARERQEPTHRELRTRRGAQLGVAKPRQPDDRGRKRDAGTDERLERLLELQRLDPDGADLAHPVARGREACGLEVEDDELGVLDERVRLGAVRERDSRAPPVEASVALDDVGEERVRECRGRALEREERARRFLRRDRAAARMDQLDEAIGCVERELHRASPYTNICSCSR